MSDNSVFLSDFNHLSSLLGGRAVADAPCPECSPYRKPANRKLKVLRLWRIDDDMICYNCAHCEAHGYTHDPKGKPIHRVSMHQSNAHRKAEQAGILPLHEREAEQMRIDRAQALWRESVEPLGTWAEEYLAGRGIKLPVDPEIRLRTLRFHPHCPFPDRVSSPALLCAFTPIWRDVLDDPFYDPPPQAIHRIRGRGHDNKAMLGPVKGCAVMISPWWHVKKGGVLNVTEGVETALALYNEGVTLDRIEDPVRPIWAMGSAGAIERMPIVNRVRRINIWADNDASGRGLEAARVAAGRWIYEGHEAVIGRPASGGDYAG